MYTGCPNGTILRNFFNLPFFFREREKYASNRIYVQLIYKSFSPVFTKFQTDKFDSRIYVSYSLRLNRKPHTYMETRCTFSATKRVEKGVLMKGGKGAPFPSNSNFAEICFPFERSRSSLGQTKFRWPTCVPNGFIALFPARNSRARHNVHRLKLLYTFGESEDEGGLLACEERTRGKKGRRVEVEARFLLVKSDSQWQR